MSKKKTAKPSMLGTILVLVGIVLAIVGIVCLATTAVNLTASIKEGIVVGDLVTENYELYTGFGLVFGMIRDLTVEGVTIEIEQEINTAALSFFIVLAIGVVAAILAGIAKLMKKRKGARLLGLVSALLLIVGGILFFFLPNFLDSDLIDSVSTLNQVLSVAGGSAALTLGAGAIIPAVGGILGGALVGIGSLLK